ncbi:hypothetical protein SMC26_33025 [Actinomadura fulvescens]|uniref:hypothetical protein n=1 Tax=Actinomadura fulvescens TaxID=46160 RepID=UPI00397CEA7D
MLDSTCFQCRAVSYEFVLVGGSFAVRRTDSMQGAARLHETPRVRRKVAEDWWRALYFGAAQ